MNRNRRKQISDIYNSLNEHVESLTFLMDEEQDAHDNLPESIQNGERGEQMQNYIDSIRTAIDNIESATGELEGIFE